MKWVWLHRRDRRRLIVFCAGWGMDEHPFLPLATVESDVVLCYDYTDLTLDPEIAEAIDRYTEAYLVGWSMGVWAGQRIFAPVAERFRRRIAINGTLCPIHDQWGIPVDIFSATLEHFDENACRKLYRRMCRDRGALDVFLAHRPQRSVADQRRELEHLLQTADCRVSGAAFYTEAIIATNDLVMPTANQLRFWGQSPIHRLDGAHFVFYRWQSWDEMIAVPGKTGA